jgi:hypothetical protein
MADHIIRITDVVGNSLCIASDDGEKVHAKIVGVIKRGDKVQLSFAGIQDLTSAFLNSAIGQLYGEFDEQQLKASLLPPIEASPDDLVLLKRVVERAKEYFKDRKRFDNAEREILGDDNNQG